jgi:hypothetical protein
MHVEFWRVRCEVLTASSLKMAVLWDVAPCSLVDVYRRLRGACCVRHQGDNTSTRLQGTTSKKTGTCRSSVVILRKVNEGA